MGRRPRTIPMPTPATAADYAPPPEVAGDPDAHAAWTATVAALEAVGTLHVADRAAVTRYSLLTALHRRSMARCLDGGTTDTARSGYTQISPQFVVLMKTSRELAGLERQFGLTPASRESLKVRPRPVGENPLARFLTVSG
jgi:P27 family predicted phage terminase small subunit